MNVRATSAKCGCSTAYAVLAGLYLTARLQFAPDATLLSVAEDQFIEIPFQRLGCLIATAAVANHRLFDSKTTAITLGILPVQSGKIDGE
jgi:hypothetical protein